MDIIYTASVRAHKEERRTEEKAFYHLREYIYYHNHVRNMDVKGASAEVTDGYKERAIGHWREGDLCYKVTENSTELLIYFVVRQVELASSELGYSTEEISKQCIEDET